jgi:arylsulfatase
MLTTGLLPDRWALSPRDPDAPAWADLDNKRRQWEAMRMAVYAAQVDRMDQGIGQILQALKDTARWENTLVVFLADNGGCAEFLAEDGHVQKYDQLPPGYDRMKTGNDPRWLPGPPDTFMSYDLPWANASNTPFRRYKHWVHEGGISTPAICHWPSHIPPGTIRHQPCHIVDWMATFLELTAAEYPDSQAGRATPSLDGYSLSALLEGQENWQRPGPIFFEHEGNRALRDGDWKLVSRTVENRNGPWELYNMIDDRTELDDLADQDPRRTADMSASFDALAEQYDVLPWDNGPKPM